MGCKNRADESHITNCDICQDRLEIATRFDERGNPMCVQCYDLSCPGWEDQDEIEDYEDHGDREHDEEEEMSYGYDLFGGFDPEDYPYVADYEVYLSPDPEYLRWLPRFLRMPVRRFVCNLIGHDLNHMDPEDRHCFRCGEEFSEHDRPADCLGFTLDLCDFKRWIRSFGLGKPKVCDECGEVYVGTECPHCIPF